MLAKKVKADTALRKQNTHAALKPIADNVEVFVRDRKHPVECVKLFIGATNSGKTYNGLQRLFSDFEQNREDIHVYAAPLRLLAYEVYKKMCDRFGEEYVGFITGEEAINPDAKLLATTMEMAPDEGASILIDEAHWLTDPHRGHIWSRILIGGKYVNMYVATAAEAVPLIKILVEDAWVIEQETFERKTPLRWGGQMPLHKVPPRSAVVCFSRRGVYAIANEVRKGGLTVGVLYGALPLSARKQQLDAYERGEIDVMVTTDVIGHGINLPIDNVIFAETNKFDGFERRPLHIWEAAQIAGRAGRFGLSSEGKVYAASGVTWLTPDYGVVRNGIKAAAGQRPTDLVLETANLFPRFGDLGLDPEGGTDEAVRLTYAIEVWRRRVIQRVKGRNLSASAMTTAIANLKAVLGFLGAPDKLWTEEFNLVSKRQLKGNMNVNVLDVWRLMTGAFDARNGVVEPSLHWLALSEEDRLTSDRMLATFAELVEKPTSTEGVSLVELEGASAKLGEFKMFSVIFDNLGLLSKEQIAATEIALNAAIEKQLTSGATEVSEHPCKECGRAAPLQFDICNKCHRLRHQPPQQGRSGQGRGQKQKPQGSRRTGKKIPFGVQAALY
jgi:ATP-dependent RNA helicase SUPV3L1/SUV3